MAASKSHTAKSDGLEKSPGISSPPLHDDKAQNNIERIQFLQQYGFTADQFHQTGLDWLVLDQVCQHHATKSAELQSVGAYVVALLQELPAVHSLKARVKHSEHLIAKIIRKKLEQPDRIIESSSYENEIADLIGVRALHLFKDDWKLIDRFIKDTWDLHEEPVAYIREGDPYDFSDAGCRVAVHPFGYRSIHYVIKFQPTKRISLVEIQVRTIFEEGWSEIDHRVRYPRYSNDPQLAMFLTIFNRLAGSADEMGTFTQMLSAYLRDQLALNEDNTRQMREKENELKKTISELAITKEQKSALQQQVRELRGSLAPFAGVANSFQSVLGSPLSGNIVDSYMASLAAPMICARCGKSFKTVFGNLSAFASLTSLGIGPVCPECMMAGGVRTTGGTAKNNP